MGNAGNKIGQVGMLIDETGFVQGYRNPVDRTDVLVPWGNSNQKKRMPAGNRNRLSTTTGTSASAGFTTAVTFWTPKSNGYSEVTAEWDNFLYQANGQPLVGGLEAIDMIKAAVEYPIGSGLTYPMYLQTISGSVEDGTARGGTIQPGQYGKWKATVNIPRNSQYRIRYYGVTQGSPTYTVINGLLTHSGKQDGFGTGDVVDSGSLTLYAATTQLRWTPNFVTGTPDVAGVPRIAFIGDSRQAGSGVASEPWSGSVQGDWISTGHQGIFPYLNRSDCSWMELALQGELPYINLGIPSSQALSWTVANRANELRILQEIDPTHIILDLCINDLLTGATGAFTIGRIQTNIALLRSYFPNAQIWFVTPPPVSNSSDSYATLANQALSGTLAAGGTPSNWALFTDNAGASGRSQVLAAIRNNTIGADGIIDVSAWLSDPTDERYWNSLYGIFTGDGIHQNNPGHMRARQAVDVEKIFGIKIDKTNPAKVVRTGTSIFVGNWDRFVPVSTAGGVATVTLPRVPMLDQMVTVSDVGNNAATNNITVNDADGNLVKTMNTNSGSNTFVYEAGGTAHRWMVY